MEVVNSYIYSSTSSKVHVILKLYTDNYYCIVGHLGGGGGVKIFMDVVLHCLKN